MRKLNLKLVSHRLGSWKWAKTRCFWRLSIVDTDFEHYDKPGYKGYIKTLWEGQHHTRDYNGGLYGFAEHDKIAQNILNEYKKQSLTRKKYHVEK